MVAQKIQTLFTDDLDGRKADDTVQPGLADPEHQIHLSTGHARALPDTLTRRRAAWLPLARGSGARRPARTERGPPGERAEQHRSPRLGRSTMHRPKDRSGPPWRMPAEPSVKFKAATAR